MPKQAPEFPPSFAPTLKGADRPNLPGVRHNERGAHARPAVDQHAENGVETDGARSDALTALANVGRKRVELGLRQAKSGRRFDEPVIDQIEVIPCRA